MNYKKIYKQIIEKAKLDNRVKSKEFYYERHHILPDFMFANRKRKGPKGHLSGNPNDQNNIVLLTPREHFICHALMAKIFIGSRYEFQAKSSLIFFFTKVIGKHQRQLNGAIIASSKKYEKYRKIGLEGISNSRKNKFPAIDSETKVSVGSVDRNHPNVLSGKWVHATKGRKISPEERARKKPSGGNLNNNYKEMTEERKQRIFDLIPSCVVENHLKIKVLDDKLKKEFKEFSKISIVWIKNNFGNYDSLVDEFNRQRNQNIKYNPYFRSQETKSLISSIFNGKKWFTNGNVNLLLSNDQIVPEGYQLGKTYAQNKKN